MWQLGRSDSWSLSDNPSALLLSAGEVKLTKLRGAINMAMKDKFECG